MSTICGDAAQISRNSIGLPELYAKLYPVNSATAAVQDQQEWQVQADVRGMGQGGRLHHLSRDILRGQRPHPWGSLGSGVFHLPHHAEAHRENGERRV